MKQRVLLAALLAVTSLLWLKYEPPEHAGSQKTDAVAENQQLIKAIEQQKQDYQVQGAGVVTRVLEDDLSGSKHQRFLLRITKDKTVLVAHNIDLAPRIKDLNSGDRVEFYGEYEWNRKGGVIHWTHSDPSGRHVGGWLAHGGRKYQ